MIKWLKSKTMVFNGVIAALGAAEAVFNLLQPHLPGNVYAYAFVILTVGNAYLRTITTQPLADK